MYTFQAINWYPLLKSPKSIRRSNNNLALVCINNWVFALLELRAYKKPLRKAHIKTLRESSYRLIISSRTLLLAPPSGALIEGLEE